MLRKLVAAVFVVALGLTSVPEVRAATVLHFEQVGSDVIGTFSGTLDLTGATIIRTGGLGMPDAFITSVTGSFVSAPNAPPGVVVPVEFYDISGGGPYGANSPDFGVASSSSASEVLGIEGGGVPRLWVNAGTTFLNMSGQMIFLDQNFNDLGLADGASVVWSLDNGETVTINVGSVAAVPLPGSMWGATLGLAALLVVRRRRRHG